MGLRLNTVIFSNAIYGVIVVVTHVRNQKFGKGLLMRTMSVDDELYGALEAAAGRNGRPIQELVEETIMSGLADAAMDDADHDKIEHARAEAVKRGGIEFEAFFDELFKRSGLIVRAI